MADKSYDYGGRNAFAEMGTYFKNKMPKVDSAVTESSGNAVSSSAVYSYVMEQIAKVGGISFKKADTLPATGDGKYIYLVPKSTAKTSNIYDEYIWCNSAWELIGTTEIDLSEYVKSSEIPEILDEHFHTLTNEEISDILEQAGF